MKKRALTIVLTVLLFLSAVTLGVSAVFRVDTVSVELTVLSEEAKKQSHQLRTDLISAYKKDGMLFADEEKAEEILTKYPHLHIEEFRKSYPNKLIFKIAEDVESYAVEVNGSYYVLSGKGIILDVRNTATNRLDGGENVVIKGLQVQGVKGGTLSGDSCWDTLFAICRQMDGELNGIRRNVTSVEVLYRTPQTYYAITMREGVRIYVENPSSQTEEKVLAGMEKYASLSETEKMTGSIFVFDDVSNTPPQYNKDNVNFG